MTDSHHRWNEMRNACNRSAGIALSRLPKMEAQMPSTVLPVCEDIRATCALLDAGKLRRHRIWTENLARSTHDVGAAVDDADLLTGHGKAVSAIDGEFNEHAVRGVGMRLRVMAPVGGMYHNHVPRLMVRSGLEARPDRLTLAILMDVEQRA